MSCGLNLSCGSNSWNLASGHLLKYKYEYSSMYAIYLWRVPSSMPWMHVIGFDEYSSNWFHLAENIWTMALGTRIRTRVAAQNCGWPSRKNVILRIISEKITLLTKLSRPRLKKLVLVLVFVLAILLVLVLVLSLSLSLSFPCLSPCPCHCPCSNPCPYCPSSVCLRFWNLVLSSFLSYPCPILTSLSLSYSY